MAHRLAAAWSVADPGGDTLGSPGAVLDPLREAAARARTWPMPALYATLAGWLLLALTALIGVPVGA